MEINDDRIIDIIVSTVPITMIILTFLFIFLKIGNVINWEWWIIFSPFLITLLLGFLFIIVILIIIYVESKFK